MNILLKKLLKMRLKRDFFNQETTLVAQKLLGKLLVLSRGHTVLVGMIVETESYRSDDPASHAFIGKTQRNSAMFGPIGHAYVYMIHGLHYGFNIVARDKSDPAGAVLIRAVEPLEGIEVMEKNRKRSLSNKLLKNLTNGPGKLTQALGIQRQHNNLDLVTSCELFVAENLLYPAGQQTILRSPRIGISKGQSYLWRFFIQGNTFVSPFKPYN